MNSCPHCGREQNSTNANRCDCQNNGMQNHGQQVVVPEVVQNNQQSYNQNNSYGSYSSHSHGNGQGGAWSNASFKTWTFKQGSPMGQVSNESCLPTFITIGIAISIGVQLGLLASIGFLVFYAIGSGISFFITMRRMLQGIPTSPWIGRVLVWLAATFITTGLAS